MGMDCNAYANGKLRSHSIIGNAVADTLRHLAGRLCACFRQHDRKLVPAVARSGKVVARNGLRMMPLFPPPPLSTVRRVFPSTAGRLAYQTAPSLTSRWLSLHPASSASRQLCVCPSCTPWLHLTFRSVSEQCARWCTAMRGVVSSTPEALAPVWVILSQSIIT